MTNKATVVIASQSMIRGRMQTTYKEVDRRSTIYAISRRIIARKSFHDRGYITASEFKVYTKDMPWDAITLEEIAMSYPLTFKVEEWNARGKTTTRLYYMSHAGVLA